MPPKQKIKASAAWMFIVKDVRLLEHDASHQYRFNRFFAIVWGIAMIVIPFDATLYGHNISALIIQEISLWANFATHFSGMSSALAAKNTSKTLDDTTDVVQDLSDDIDDIHDVTEKLDDVLLPPLN